MVAEKTTTEKRYTEAVGRRKTAVARVRLFEAAKTSFVINGDRDLATYFPTEKLQLIVTEVFSEPKIGLNFKITAMIEGGGINSQAEALRLGIARALVTIDSELRATLKPIGFLTRDQRAKERRKFGLKKARKAPQWSKR